MAKTVRQDDGDASMDEQISAQLDEYLSARVQITEAMNEAEESRSELDEEIKVFMIQNHVDDNWHKSAELGMMMKISSGTNRSIIEKDLRQALLDIELEPEVIDWIVDQAVKTTQYDYVDMRKAGKGK